MIHAAATAQHHGKLDTGAHGDAWMTRLANLDERATYLERALAELVGNTPDGHRTAAMLLSEMTVVAEQQRAALARAVLMSRREGSDPYQAAWAKPAVLGFRIFAFTVVASSAFMLTTWLRTFP